jgi:hypothetical protein
VRPWVLFLVLKKEKENWRRTDSRAKVPALQEQSPEFKTPNPQKKKKKKKHVLNVWENSIQWKHQCIFNVFDFSFSSNCKRVKC